MADMSNVWETEYVAPGATIGKEQFKRLVEIGYLETILARELPGALIPTACGVERPRRNR